VQSSGEPETIASQSEEETVGIARRLADTLAAGDIVLLFGDLGAGKTAFVRGLAEGLNIDPADVTSPTFTLVQEYRAGRLPLIHVDLYRLNNPREIDDLGLEELGANAVLAIEWADRMPRPVAGAIEVRFTNLEGDNRTIRIDHSIRALPGK
jgi:tRNA threonylcarbamoyladenosine biosynthesis protein TsaE